MTRYQFQIEGMGCNACVRKVQSALGSISGLRIENVAVGSATVDLSMPASFEHVTNALANAGYKVGETVTCPMAGDSQLHEKCAELGSKTVKE